MPRDKDETATMAIDSGVEPHAWLDANATRTAADLVLGGILLVAGMVAIWDAGQIFSDRRSMLGAGFFPTVVGGSLCLVGLLLLVRGAFLGPPRAQCLRPRYLLMVVAGIALFILAMRAWGDELALQFGPSEFATFIALELAIAIALARTSRTRAAGMALLGLALAAIGIDVSTGVPRLTMGFEALMTGIDVTTVLFGLFVLADGAICLASPSLYLATYTRQVCGWRTPMIRNFAAHSMRVVAALAVAAACYYAYALNAGIVDVLWVLVFGVLGAASKVYRWNRLVLYLAFAGGSLFEENIRRAMLLSQGDLAIFLNRPISGTLLVLTGAVLATAAILSVRRTFTQPPATV